MDFVKLLYLVSVHNNIFSESQQGLFRNRNQSRLQRNLLSKVIVFLAVTFVIFPQIFIFCCKLIILETQNFCFLLSRFCDFLCLRIGCIKRFLRSSANYISFGFCFFPDVVRLKIKK